MAKLYTLDNKLLISTPEVRIGDKVFPVDDRAKTVKKAMKLFENNKNDDLDNVDELFRLAYGEQHAREINEMELSFKALTALVELTLSAMTGEEIKSDSGSSEVGKVV